MPAYSQADIVSKLTEFCKVSGEIESLTTEYEAKLAEKPEDPLLIYLAASMKIAANDLEDSDTLVNQLLNLVSINVEWLSSLATTYRNVGDRDRELRLLEATIAKIDPQNWWQLSQNYQKLGTAYAQKGEKEKAQNTFRRMGAAGILGGSSFYEKEQIGATYMQHEMWGDAEALFTEIINDLSAQRWNREEAQQQLMEIKRRRDGLAGTTRLAEKTQEMNFGTQRALAQQYMRRNQLTKAVEIYEQIATVMPEDLESRADLAAIYSRQSKHDKAIDTWKELLEADPENTKYQGGLVNAYRSADRISEAIELAQEYIDEEVDNSVHYVRLAKVYAAGDQVDDAIATYKKAIALTPGNGRAYRELAQLYLRKDDLEAAEKTFLEAIQYTGQEAERRSIERQLINLYRRQGRLEEMLKKAEDEGTLTFAMQQDRAQRYRSEGRLEKAVDAYKKALDMTAQSWERNNIFNELVRLYVQLGEDDLAMEVYETLSRSGSTGMSISPSPSGVKVTFGGDEAREILIKAYKNQGKLEQLKTHFEGRLEKEADDPALLEMVAEIYRNTNDYERAAQAYQALCKAQPGNVRNFYYAAATLNRSNQPDLVQALLDQGEVALSASNHRRDMWFLAAMATICLDGNMYTPAIKFAEEAIATSGRFGGFDWGHEHLYNILGKSYLGSGQPEKIKAMIQSESDTEAGTGLVMLLADHYVRNEQTDKISLLLSEAAESTQNLESKALYIGVMIYHLYQAGEIEKIAELVPGSFVREAESADTISREFKVEKDSSASGGEFLEGLGDDVYDKEEIVGELNEVVFDINVQQAGDYKIIARVLAPDGKADSFFVKFGDREKFYTWDTRRSSTWRWQVLTVRPLGREEGNYTHEHDGPIRFPLSVGEHQLKLKKRESGTKIDVFVFYRLQ